MTTLDAALLDLLSSPDGLSPSEQDELKAWWRDEGQSGEGLVAFLSRVAGLGNAGRRMIELVGRGYLAPQAVRPSFLGDHAAGIVAGVRRRAEAARPTDAAACVAGGLEAADPAAATRKHSLSRTMLSPPPATPPSALRSDGPAATEPESLQVGTTLGKCLLIRELGQGGACVVYQALHTSLQIPVAVKVVQPWLVAERPHLLGQLQHEARLLARLSHPHVVRVWDFEANAAYPHLILDFVEGPSLADLLGQYGRLPLDRAARLVTQVSLALEAAAELGIVHRDVKPGNILLTRDGTAKLADLGLAVVVRERITGGVSGTAFYMAPEQFTQTTPVDFRSDVYALGATFYHALTGELPFTGENAYEVMVQHAGENPLPPHERVPGLPPAASAVVLKMMAKSPQDRYQTYGELRAALAALLVPASAPAPAKRADSGSLSGVTALWKSVRRQFGSAG